MAICPHCDNTVRSHDADTCEFKYRHAISISRTLPTKVARTRKSKSKSAGSGDEAGGGGSGPYRREPIVQHNSVSPSVSNPIGTIPSAPKSSQLLLGSLSAGAAPALPEVKMSSTARVQKDQNLKDFGAFDKLLSKASKGGHGSQQQQSHASVSSSPKSKSAKVPKRKK
mmetsp:Transcript_44261/g.86602  ORF Transcript_44261/g.86602 Transcript_44261/m.86602 type:complete len:169 (+) Transcript_44261:355-861(+)